MIKILVGEPTQLDGHYWDMNELESCIKEVDIDEMFYQYRDYESDWDTNGRGEELKPFSEYLMEKIGEK